MQPEQSGRSFNLQNNIYIYIYIYIYTAALKEKIAFGK